MPGQHKVILHALHLVCSGLVQVAFWACATAIVVVGLVLMLVVMAVARHKRLLFIPNAHH